MPRTLDDSPAKIVRKLLLDMDEGVDPEFTTGKYTGDPWPAFYGAEPPIPDNVLVVNDTTGHRDGVTFDGEIQEHFGFQIMVRSIDHDTGWAKAHALRAALSETVLQVTVLVGSNVYLIPAIVNMGQVMNMGKESQTSKRSLFTVNAELSVRQQE